MGDKVVRYNWRLVVSHFKIISLLSQAGLASSSNPEQVLIALEPEAASVYCRERKVGEFINESGSDESLLSDNLSYPKTQYVVVDIGGTRNEIQN